MEYNEDIMDKKRIDEDEKKCDEQLEKKKQELIDFVNNELDRLHKGLFDDDKNPDSES